MELAKALQGVAEANALAAKGIAIERGVESEQIAGSEALALHAAAYNGMPDPVFHLVERAIGIVAALAAVGPDPRAGESDMLLDTALHAATALAQLLQAPCVISPPRVDSRVRRSYFFEVTEGRGFRENAPARIACAQIRFREHATGRGAAGQQAIIGRSP